MHRSYTLIFRAPHRLNTERSDTKPTFESPRIAIAPLSASSRPYGPFLRRPRALLERSARNLSNKNVSICQSKVKMSPHNCYVKMSLPGHSSLSLFRLLPAEAFGRVPLAHAMHSAP